MTEKILNSEFNYKIMVITDISGWDGIFTITFKTRNERGFSDGNCFRLTFENVYGLTYSTENMNIGRFGYMERVEDITSDICIIENSNYINHFKGSVFEALEGTDQLKHYVITDYMDTVIDILEADYPNSKKPKLEKIEDEKSEIDKLKQENEQLKWWKTNSENQNAMQIDAEELKQFREWKKEREEWAQFGF